jgi:hypothetical protein
MSRGTKAKRSQTEAQRAAQAAREAKVLRVQLTLGYAIVALSVIAGFVMSFWPQVIGLRESNPAIGFGLAALAAFRLYALRKELQRQSAEARETAVAPQAPQRGAPASAKRVSSGRTLP